MIPTTSENFIFLPAFLSDNHNGLRIHKSFTISRLIIQSKVSGQLWFMSFFAARKKYFSRENTHKPKQSENFPGQ